MLFVFTGNGKGKTTSAIGQALRVLGHGGKVAFLQFIKSPEWKTGEAKMAKRFGKNFLFFAGGRGFVGIMGDKLPISAHKNAAQKLWQEARKIIQNGKFDLIVLDEINIALALKLLDGTQTIGFLKERAEKTDIICTGRYCPPQLMKVADLATECREIKHPFIRGMRGKIGREF